MRLTPRNPVRIAGTVSVVMIAALAVGIPSAAADIGVRTSFVCVAANSTYEVGVRVSGKAPAAGEVGKPIFIGKLAVSLDVPQAMLSGDASTTPAPEPGNRAEGQTGLPVEAARSAQASAQIFVTAAQNGEMLPVGAWPGFKLNSRQKAASSKNGVTLEGEIKPPALTPLGAGGVSLQAYALTLDLIPAGSAGRVTVTCTPKTAVTLATLRIRQQAQKSPESGLAPPPVRKAAAPADTECTEIPAPPAPGEGMNPAPALQVFESPEHPDVGLPKTPTPYREVKSLGAAYCVKLSGFANVKKLNSAVPVGAVAEVRRGILGRLRSGEPYKYAYQQTNGYANAKAAPSTGAALGFGFMPTVVTAQVNQVAGPGSGGNIMGNFRGDIWNNQTGYSGHPDNWAYQRSFVGVDVQKVQVNGLSVPVGSDCGTGPTLLHVQNFLGNEKTRVNNIDAGGIYEGTVSIPNFSKCGIGEDLSPLLSATTSGPGNFVSLNGAKWCRFILGKCGPLDEPVTWTISPGGEVVATARPFEISNGAGSRIKCDSATLSLKFKKGKWKAGFRVGDVRKMTFSKCFLEIPGHGPVSWKVEASGFPGAINFLSEGADGPDMEIRRVQINTSGLWNGEKCLLGFGESASVDGEQVLAPGNLTGTYSNSSKSLNSVQAATSMPVPKCDERPPGFEESTYYYDGKFVFSPGQRIVTP